MAVGSVGKSIDEVCDKQISCIEGVSSKINHFYIISASLLEGFVFWDVRAECGYA
jgi:hypothetical protein